jgi:MFS family permease
MSTIMEGKTNEAQASSHLWHDAQWPLTLGLVSVVAVAAFEALAVSTILPAVVHDLGGLALYGWVFTAYALTNVIGLVIASALADQHGPALPFELGGACFTTGLLLAGVAPSMAVVVAGARRARIRRRHLIRGRVCHRGTRLSGGGASPHAGDAG